MESYEVEIERKCVQLFDTARRLGNTGKLVLIQAEVLEGFGKSAEREKGFVEQLIKYLDSTISEINSHRLDYVGTVGTIGVAVGLHVEDQNYDYYKEAADSLREAVSNDQKLQQVPVKESKETQGSNQEIKKEQNYKVNVVEPSKKEVSEKVEEKKVQNCDQLPAKETKQIRALEA